MALMGTGEYTSYDDAYQHAVDSLESGAAQQSLEKLLSLQP
jgi:hypothetical protein